MTNPDFQRYYTLKVGIKIPYALFPLLTSINYILEKTVKNLKFF